MKIRSYRRFTLQSLLILIIGVGAATMLQNLTGTTVAVQNGSKTNLAPNTYWVDSRSHHELGFDQNSYIQAMERINQIKQRQNFSREGDLDKEWKIEGPGNIGGRINVLEIPSISGDTMYAGAHNGGVFRTHDGGKSWKPIFDFQAYMSVGAIAVDGQNIYVGTGDRNFGGGSSIGDGIYYSSDYGTNWKKIGPYDIGCIVDICIDPNDKSTMVVGTLGSPLKSSKKRGIYRTTDGGATWTNTLFVSDTSGNCDLIRDPNNTNTLYCCFFNRVNFYSTKRYVAEGPDSKIYKSTDGGVSWKQLTNGLPSGKLGRIGIDVAATNSDILYAVYSDTAGNVLDIFKSTDAGENWQGLNATQSELIKEAYNGMGWRFSAIYINPFNEKHIVLTGVDMFHSLDGGKTWSQNVPDWQTDEVHADKQDVKFLDKNSFVITTDGGLYKTTDLGENWQDIEDIPLTQFYDITVSDLLNGKYGGGAQDNGTTIGNSSDLTGWTRHFGGDGFKFTPTSLGYDLCETQLGGIFMRRTSQWDYDELKFEQTENKSWFTPYEFNETAEDIVVGSDRLIYFDNLPNGRKYISTKLTRAGTESLSTYKRFISELERDASNPDHLLVGTTDGLVWKGNIIGGMNNWQNISGNWGEFRVSSVNHSSVDENTYFVALTGYINPDTSSKIFKTVDGGQNWTSIRGDLPQIGINDLLIEPNGNDQIIFAATDAGVFLTQNGGGNWEMMGTNLPTINVTEVELDYKNERLIAGTYARSIWSYDVSFLKLEQSTGINEINSTTSVYPNPTSNKLHIKGIKPNTKLKVISVSGKIVEKFLTNSDYVVINSQNWSPGMYTVVYDNQVARVLKQ